MSRMKSRLLVASMVCIVIGGCKATGVGDPLPSGGLVRFLIYAPPNSDLQLKIIEDPDSPVLLGRDPAFDNHPKRPAGIPSTDVAYLGFRTLPGGITYHGELFAKSPLTGKYEYADEVKPWTANSLVLIEQD